MDIIQIGNYIPQAKFKNYQCGRVYSSGGGIASVQYQLRWQQRNKNAHMHKDCIKLGNVLPSQHRVGIVYGMGGYFLHFLKITEKYF